MVGNGEKWRKIDKNGLKWMEIVETTKMAQIAKMVKMAKNGPQWQTKLKIRSELPTMLYTRRHQSRAFGQGQ